MKTYQVTLKSVSPYSQSRKHNEPKEEREIPEDYEKRTWRKRLHVDQDGEVFIPPMALKNCLSEVAKFMGIQIPGKGKANYTKHFEAGILIQEPIMLGVKKDDFDDDDGEWLFLPADGKRGGGKRVWKCYPKIDKWAGTVMIHVLDEIITDKVLRQHLDMAGTFIGIGRFRPRNNGFYGRFEVSGFECVG